MIFKPIMLQLKKENVVVLKLFMLASNIFVQFQ